MTRMLRRDHSGDDVASLQSRLNYHRTDADTVPLNEDGQFGPRTDERVRAFQRLNGLDPDGIVGPLTAAQLATVCSFIAEYTAQRTDVPAQTDTQSLSDPSGESFTLELKSGVKVALSDPWKPPPAKSAYTLGFQGSWIMKNPGSTGQLVLGVGAEIGRVLPTPTADGNYTYWGVGKILSRVEESVKLGSVKLNTGAQVAFEVTHGVQSDHVLSLAARASLVSGISFALVKDRFYLFGQGDVGCAVTATPPEIKTSALWIGMLGFKAYLF